MIVQPIVVLGAPRSGTTILQRCLIVHPQLWHLPGESHGILEGPFHPAACGYRSNRVRGEQLSAEVRSRLLDEFERGAVNLNRLIPDPGRLLAADGLLGRILYRGCVATAGRLSQVARPRTIRLCEKTPKNSLRVPLLERLFPDARYVWIQREAEENIASLAAGWLEADAAGRGRSRRFSRAGYPIAAELKLTDYPERWWKFALVPGWRRLAGQTIADVAAWQYYQCNRYTLRDLAEVEPERVRVLRYRDLVAEPEATVQGILSWAGLDASRAVTSFTRRLPRINASRSGGATSARRSASDAIDRLAAAHPLDALCRAMADVAERGTFAAAGVLPGVP